jgi:hypothetical protein
VIRGNRSYKHSLCEAAAILREDRRFRHIHWMATHVVKQCCLASKTEPLWRDDRCPDFYIPLRRKPVSRDWLGRPRAWEEATQDYYDTSYLDALAAQKFGWCCPLCGSVSYQDYKLFDDLCSFCRMERGRWFRRQGLQPPSSFDERDNNGNAFLLWIMGRFRKKAWREAYLRRSRQWHRPV